MTQRLRCLCAIGGRWTAPECARENGPRPAHRPQTAQNNDARQTTGDIPGTDTPEPRWAARWAGESGGVAVFEERMSGVPGEFVALKWLDWG